ncbi:hypothetical protein HDV05_001119 [Chytridiales sp. JEL 0842]|nr:hypothetical protein HDV05_001119 [Chytridiales sp. JEL 0842]
MSCLHLNQTRVTLPTASTLIHKEECTVCFHGQDDPEGIDVCLSCFSGGCRTSDANHAQLHYDKFKHPLALNIKRILKPTRSADHPPPNKISKLAIEVENEAEKYDFITQLKCYGCNYADVDAPVDSAVAKIVPAIMSALSSKKMSDVKAWELETTSCTHTQNLVQHESRILESLATAHCSQCDLKENLWLCLVCGNLGCGRQQFGGLGGNGHGVEHFKQTQHAISCKLGTITPEGTADIYCYICDDEKVDPSLAKHLANFGINIQAQQKTEKSLAELQLEQNMKFDFSMTTEDGKSFTPLFGPGLTGMKNLGNTCYMASVCQTVFALPTFESRYMGWGKDHILKCRDDCAQCFHCQMSKLADGLLSGSYAKPFKLEDGTEGHQIGITPSMFKSVISKGHPDFLSMRQQDAQEFFQHFVKLIEQKERAGGSDPTKTFKFNTEQRIQCLECQNVRYVEEKGSILLNLPVSAELNTDGETYAPTTLNQSLEMYFADEPRSFSCPTCKKITNLTSRSRMKTFPETLVFVMNRFVQGSDYVMKKLNVSIDAPFTVHLDAYRGVGPLPGETLFPDDADSGPIIDELACEQIIQMGFPRNRAVKALLATGNSGADAAMNWLFEHMDDPDAPIENKKLNGGGPPAELVEQVMMMGFTDLQAKKALRETSNDIERAVDWLFNHPDETGLDDAPSTAPVGAGSDGTPDYNLVGFISHKGTSTHCGHYVAHLLKNGKWVLFNDEKVVQVPDIAKAIGEAYIYIYQRAV